MYEATIFLSNIAQGVNDYNGNKYVKVADLQNNWPELLNKGPNQKMELVTKKFIIEGFEEPKEYIKLNKNKGLTHLLVNENDKFFEDVYMNEKNYSNLQKIYDSNNFNKNIKYKIFKIIDK